MKKKFFEHKFDNGQFFCFPLGIAKLNDARVRAQKARFALEQLIRQI